MVACVWIQFEPVLSITPYPGFINATVSGDTLDPPALPAPRVQFAVPVGTTTLGMMVSATALTSQPNSLLSASVLVSDPSLGFGASAV